jgi:DNA-binding Lrp family transcriptional regulator
MDAMDKVIILALAMNCRLPYQSIARKLGVSSNAVKKRVDRLVDEGVITNFTVELSLAMFGGESALVLVTTDGTEDEEEFCDVLGANSMIGVVGPSSMSTYVAFAVYIGSEGLSALSTFIRAQKSVKDVQIIPIMYLKGKRVHFTKSHLRVLRLLVEDPRMKVGDISKRTGFAPRTARRLVNEIAESEGVRLGLMWDLNAGDGISFMLRVEWYPDKADSSRILQQLAGFPEFYTPIISATQPVIFAAFVVSDIKEIDGLVKKMRSNAAIKSLVTYLGKKSRIYPDIRNIKLQELLATLPSPR